MANLEYDIPVTSKSIFAVASMSKQFTAFCIVLLAREGKLSLDDDIRKYLPYISDFGVKISIRNLLTHTSGLRDEWQDLEIAGYRLDDVITQDQIIKMASKQRTLNFKPGEQFLYCNTGYILLAEIIKKVSGLSLKEFANQNIFKPLDMTNTQFQEDYKEVVKNKVYSYKPAGDTVFEKCILNYSIIGSTGLLTTVEDDAKWLLNFETDTLGGKGVIDSMCQRTELSDGRIVGYAFGLINDDYKGWKRIWHGGIDAGYRSYSCYFPEKHLGIALFSNLSTFSARANAMKIADLFLEEKSKATTAESPIPVDIKKAKIYLGKYVSEEGFVGEVVQDSSKLLFLKTSNKLYSMKKTDEDQFYVSGWDMTIKFDKAVNKEAKGFTMFGDYTQYASRVLPYNASEEQLKKYAGTYYNEELEVMYHIGYTSNQLILSYKRFSPTPLKFINVDQCQSGYEGMENLVFKRDSKGQIKGFEVNSGRVLHLQFKKIDLKH